MSEIDYEKLAEIELQKDEAEDAQSEQEKTFIPPPLEDPELNINHPYYDVARHGIIQLAGDDNSGRKVITFSCCRMPPSYQLNHTRLLEYLKYTLDQYVENDYTVVYFHYGLKSLNKPSLKWLQTAYKEFDRKYKKNLKALYVVHPTNFIKILWNIFKPLISHKFGKKVTYLNYLSDLREHLKYDQLNIPPEVIRHDENLRRKQKGKLPPIVKVPPPRPPLPTQQFGVSLQYIKDKNKGELIPPVMKETVSYLKRKAFEKEVKSLEKVFPMYKAAYLSITVKSQAKGIRCLSSFPSLILRPQLGTYADAAQVLGRGKHHRSNQIFTYLSPALLKHRKNKEQLTDVLLNSCASWKSEKMSCMRAASMPRLIISPLQKHSCC